MARPEKVAAVKDIAARFSEADAALLTEYRGLKVTEIAEVRNALRDANADYKVLKNTLARIAVREAGLDDLVEWLEGPTAIVFVKGDVVEAAKALDEAAKKYPVLVVKGGALRGGKLIGADDAKALAKLESREVLLTKIAMLFNQPAQQTVNVLSALLRDLGSMLAQVVAKKESGELPGGDAEAPAAEGDAGPAAEAEQAKPEGDTETPEVEEAGAGAEDDAGPADAETQTSEAAETETAKTEAPESPAAEAGNDDEAGSEEAPETASAPEASADEEAVEDSKEEEK